MAPLRLLVAYSSKNRSTAEMAVWIGEGPRDQGLRDQSLRTDVAATGAEEHRTFGGRLTDGAGGFLAGRILKENVGGDFRNEQEVRAWGADIAARLRSERESI